MNRTLPTDSTTRKAFGLARYADDYFPAAFAGIARHSFVAGAKHTGGLPVHKRWTSNDHRDCIRRHLMDIADIEAALVRSEKDYSADAWPAVRAAAVADLLAEADALAWRACALSQIIHETYGGAPLAPAAQLAETSGGDDGTTIGELQVRVDASSAQRTVEMLTQQVEALNRELGKARAPADPLGRMMGALREQGAKGPFTLAAAGKLFRLTPVKKTGRTPQKVKAKTRGKRIR